MLCETLTQQCIDRNEDTSFCLMNPIYKRERGVFWNNLELRYTIFFEMQYQQIMNNANSLCVLFQQLNANIFE
jgi:hypothetical protein